MRVAFLSYEFPPETGGGGIGTYLNQTTGALTTLGHDVTVFAGGEFTSDVRRDDGVLIRRVACQSSPDFRRAVVDPFSAEHQRLPFDVMEGCDFDASALEVKARFPRLPYVCKLHTPRFAIDELHHRVPHWFVRFRMTIGALRRGRKPPAFGPGNLRTSENAIAEIQAITCADAIAAPSVAIARMAAQWVPGSEDRIHVFPYLFVPPPAFLEVQVDTDTRRVMYLGRLEERKGVLDLAEAIRIVVARLPNVSFRFVGRVMPVGPQRVPADQMIRRHVGKAISAVEFLGAQPPSGIPALMGDADILVVPSHWESFGLVCCEGLAAARGVIASNSGGMVEILDGGACGTLVPPRSPMRLADAICSQITNPAARHKLGVAGRERVLSTYSSKHVLPAQMSCYHAAIGLSLKGGGH